MKTFPPKRRISTLALPAVFLTRCLIVFSLFGTGASALADEYVNGQRAADRFPLADGETTADIHVSENDWKVAKIAAGDYAIVMGSSHIEPMLRNNMHGAEWDREGGGDWNYLTNRDAIQRYWERRIQANGRYENLYTLGMRGKDDEPMYGEGTLAERVDLLERIFRDQRSILARHIDPDPAKVPQVFIPYTEVLGMHEAGMKVPDDVIICWPDDNFGYLRRLPTEEERKRPGGSGVYYHLQWLNGATTAYTWLNTMPLALMAAEMRSGVAVAFQEFDATVGLRETDPVVTHHS